jgi:hypothetical protein
MNEHTTVGTQGLPHRPVPTAAFQMRIRAQKSQINERSNRIRIRNTASKQSVKINVHDKNLNLLT